MAAANIPPNPRPYHRRSVPNPLPYDRRPVPYQSRDRQGAVEFGPWHSCGCIFDEPALGKQLQYADSDEYKRAK